MESAQNSWVDKEQAYEPYKYIEAFTLRVNRLTVAINLSLLYKLGFKNIVEEIKVFFRAASLEILGPSL